MNTPDTQRPTDSPEGARASFRIGHGYDLHRLEPLPPDGGGRPLIIGGVDIPHHAGPIAHSDGDALLHAVTDALLGALALPDIGQLFPDDDQQNESRASADFLRRAVDEVRARGWTPVNLDATIILERPRLSPFKDRIRASVCEFLGLPLDAVNVKGKSHEQVDAVGEGRAIEVHAVVLLTRDP